MSGTGAYSSLFRTGNSANTNLELIFKSLNDAQGTAYSVNYEGSIDTIAAVENYAVGKAINSIWENNQRLAYQSDPLRMSPIFVPRWEKILGIYPDPNSAIADRLHNIQIKFSIWTKPPVPENIFDLLKATIPAIFIKVIHNLPEDNQGSVPGGAVVPGGVDLPELLGNDGQPLWFSSVSIFYIQTWQPRDHLDNKLMTDADYYAQNESFINFLDNYLPAYVNFYPFRYVSNGPGTISIGSNSNLVTGVSTTFTTTFEVGDTFEAVDDLGQVGEFTIISITDDTHLTTLELSDASNTDGFYRILGFILDDPENLDNETFGDL